MAAAALFVLKVGLAIVVIFAAFAVGVALLARVVERMWRS